MPNGYTAYRIPLNPPQTTLVALPTGVSYQFKLQYQNAVMGGWFLDISDNAGNALVQGIPLVTGADLLAQYEYLGIGGELWVQNDADPDAVPSFTNLGGACGLYFVLNNG